jgi:hypothetical protein
MLKRKEGQELIEYYQRQIPSAVKASKKKAANQGLGGSKKKPLSHRGKNDQNILDESFEYNAEALTRKMTILGKKKILFDGVHCDRSFYIFSRTNWLRIQAYEIITYKYFEYCIFFLVGLSSIKLVVDTYINPDYKS